MKNLEVRNPRTGVLDFSFEPISSEELKSEVKRLRDGQAHWNNIGIDGRIAVLNKWKDEVRKREKDILGSTVIDTGRLGESIREFENTFKWIDNWANVGKEIFQAPSNEEIVQSKAIPFLNMKKVVEPYPMVGIISPWNFPLSLSMMDMIPALLAGCSVIVKPSEITPRFIKPLQESINAVPELASVLKYVYGDGQVGSELVDIVDLIVFTGSEATGRKVAAQAGKNLIPAYLEMGGKDAAIITNSANLEKTSRGIVFGSVGGMGHQCFSTERIYVDKTIETKFIEQLINEAKKIPLALDSVESGLLGPIIFEPQVAIIQEHLDDAIEKGAIIHTGGEIKKIKGGYWLEPTVISNVDHTMKIMNDETFGPVMPIMAYNDIDEAISLANDTHFGLTGSVFSNDVQEAVEIAARLKTGGISINDAGIIPFVITEAPGFDAFNNSGLGASRFGKSGINRFLQDKLILIKDKTVDSLWWYDV